MGLFEKFYLGIQNWKINNILVYGNRFIYWFYFVKILSYLYPLTQSRIWSSTELSISVSKNIRRIATVADAQRESRMRAATMTLGF